MGSDPLSIDTDGDGLTDGTEVRVGANPSVVDQACAQFDQTASPAAKPVDVIFVVDNSQSMQDEIESIERNINKNFASIIEASGVDYRVLVISRHGKSAFKNICVGAPLSGTSCDPVPVNPANAERFFHYSERVSSHNSLDLILSTYRAPDMAGLAPQGWSAWLREGATKAFIEITDDEPDVLTATEFDEQLLGLTPPRFGTPGSRQYVFHSIIGVRARDVAAEAWRPGDPIQTEVCGAEGMVVASGAEYQKLSILTGGLRFPVCEFDAYDTVFRAVAGDVINQSRIRCAFGFPSVEDPQQVDPDSVALELRATAAAEPRLLNRVTNEAACGPDSFYIRDNGQVVLCPLLCEEVEGLAEGRLTFASDCLEEGETCVYDGPEICDDGIDNDCNGFADSLDGACIG